MNSLVTRQNRPDYRRTLPLNREILIIGIPVLQSPTRRTSLWRFWRLVSLGIGLLALAVLRWQHLQLDATTAFLLEKITIVGIITPIVWTVGVWHLGHNRRRWVGTAIVKKGVELWQ